MSLVPAIKCRLKYYHQALSSINSSVFSTERILRVAQQRRLQDRKTNQFWSIFSDGPSILSARTVSISNYRERDTPSLKHPTGATKANHSYSSKHPIEVLTTRSLKTSMTRKSGLDAGEMGTVTSQIRDYAAMHVRRGP
ncbi:hypothetical protein BX616_006263 [Lobosporangium transversale]|uniref:Uncharacterized protein n=1 Tax=Lobosporangium transversale TaxID=64571 RepID=A0A1Y2G5M7_9FUNG|nr:hypothetical protein BCR41DRAFT_402224 [Lobosporangium transversale]KAF9918733.1 hypothetical protein BX616_006263 [Lobosporangium transversale]ORY96006.1 hypothetical protein BCR41DRAFT_402224 [Lobosporangium transversale]|eukprot:XP_021875443.1 hypothetical protein BCR41DRAFT_402224 [Lobosporangium transversale]